MGFTLSAGEHVALMGPSGVGKSTLLSLLGLMDRPSQGRILFEGQDTAQLSNTELSRLRGKRLVRGKT